VTETEYVVHYYLIGTTTKLVVDKNVANQIIGDEVTEYAVAIAGYTADASEKSLVLAAEDNEIVFYYSLTDFSVVYEANWPSGVTGIGNVPTDDNVYHVGDDVVVESGDGLVVDGYVFGGWLYDGKIYNAGDLVEVVEDVVLAAQWDLVEYAILYHLGGGVSAPGNPDVYTVTSVFPIVIGNPSRVGYQFVGWTVVYADGSVVAGQVDYSIPAGTIGAVVLTANWRLTDIDIIYRTISYFSVGHTSGMVPVDDRSPYPSGSTVIVLGEGSLMRESYVFRGWSLDSEAVSVDYLPGNILSLTVTVDLYAVWEELPATYSVTYHPGTHGTFNEQVTLDLLFGDPTPLAPTTITGEAGWRFDGWSPKPSDTVTGNSVYTAQWAAIEYHVTYNANGGTGAPVDNVAHHVGETVTVLSGIPTRQGFTFDGWNYNGAVYQSNGGSNSFVMPAADVTLTAQWITDNTSDNNNNGSSGSSNSNGSSKPPAKPTPPPPPTNKPDVTHPPSKEPDPPEAPLAYWALVNLILSLVGLILTIIVTVCVLLQRKQRQNKKQNATQTQTAKGQYGANQAFGDNNADPAEAEKKKKQRRRLFWYLLSVILGIAGIIVFMLTEDMNRKMTLVDWWTIVNAIILIVEIIAVTFILKTEKEKDEHDDT
jgi:uncharacterized repeat protein (TIGR02543 family)